MHPFTGCGLEGKTDSRIKNGLRTDCLRDTSSSILLFSLQTKLQIYLPSTDRLWCNKTAIIKWKQNVNLRTLEPFKMPWITYTLKISCSYIGLLKGWYICKIVSSLVSNFCISFVWLTYQNNQKMSIKKCAPKLVLFNEKRLRKIAVIFDIENWLWKSTFCTLRQAGKARQSIPGRL